jgi:hypothetical protein
LRGILSLIKDIPHELLNFSSADYANLVLATSTIEQTLATWVSRGDLGLMPPVKDRDPVTVIRYVLSLCPDEYLASTTIELLSVKDDIMRDNIRGDVGATHRALNNNEWKAVTILGGATIEALLHWRLSQSPPTRAEIANAVANLKANRANFNPPASQDDWVLSHFILVAEALKFIKSDTAKAVDQARCFRNLIHPGAAVRRGQPCDKATAHSAIAALEHVIRDLS